MIKGDKRQRMSTLGGGWGGQGQVPATRHPKSSDSRRSSRSTTCDFVIGSPAVVEFILQDWLTARLVCLVSKIRLIMQKHTWEVTREMMLKAGFGKRFHKQNFKMDVQHKNERYGLFAGWCVQRHREKKAGLASILHRVRWCCIPRPGFFRLLILFSLTPCTALWLAADVADSSGCEAF